MDKFESMRIFLEVAKHASFTKAAEELGLPKASTSLYVKDLEQRLGVRLFQRTTRVVKLTQEGKIFEQRCIDLLDDIEEAEALFQKDDFEIKGRLRVDMSSGIAKKLILPELKSFYKKYPQIKIELSSSDRRVDLIGEGFDCVVRAGELESSDLMVKKLGDYKIINCASARYLKEYGTPKKLEHLKEHYLINYSQHLQDEALFEYEKEGKLSFLKMPSLLSVNNVDSYLHAALNDLGIIQIPLYGIKDYLKSGELIEILPRFKAKSMPVSILYPHRRHLPKRVKVFMDWMSENFKKTF